MCVSVCVCVCVCVCARARAHALYHIKSASVHLLTRLLCNIFTSISLMLT